MQIWESCRRMNGNSDEQKQELPPVVRAFDAAAVRYDAISRIQREIAQTLVADTRCASPKNILDLGCGTGHVTEAVLQRWPEAKVVALDRSPAMLATLKSKFPGVQTILADAARSTTLGGFDLIFSSMMLHWLSAPREALVQWRRVLAPEGQLHVAVPVEGSLGEWRDACRSANAEDGLWPFPPRGFAADLAESARLERRPATYPDARAFVKSLKGTGAHSARPGRRPLAARVIRGLLANHLSPFVATFMIEFVIIRP
jgi:malonyl-CoA O-methyltransferase